MTAPPPASPKYLLPVIGLTALLVLVLVAMWLLEQPVPQQAQEDVLPAKITAPKPEIRLKVSLSECGIVSRTAAIEGQHLGDKPKTRGNYRFMRGKVTNNGAVAVNFVQVKTIWRDSNGQILDTGTVFAVREELLKPGESAAFEDSTRNAEVQKCDAKVDDWWAPAANPEPAR